ncbi:cobalamin biosynthesis protein [Phyllobacterium sp. YR531]|uniref:cobalamin biosynthesis protein n=1 Tax=Phyllobacterium sp. YR531 TaxID=1144343 RepID=UPI00026F753D|nr:cobalamin biosynthesis protein [Phyllobacterium sp. YR531]EJN03949.1 cobalamin biosynthesis protein CbiG [Phyllobacterium sp. YR531]
MVTSYALGLGCEQGCDPAELQALAEKVLGEVSKSSLLLAGVFTIDQRLMEPAVNSVARWLGLPLKAFDADTLEQETPRLLNPSKQVFELVGCHGVAEAAALAGGGPKARLVVGKTKSAHATAALAIYDPSQ